MKPAKKYQKKPIIVVEMANLEEIKLLLSYAETVNDGYNLPSIQVLKDNLTGNLPCFEFIGGLYSAWDIRSNFNEDIPIISVNKFFGNKIYNRGKPKRQIRKIIIE